jgi:TfoX/Sxy family transcriptional regulator of competence genes
MAFDEDLDARVSQVVTPWGATRKAMFGGTGYMLEGNLMAGVYRDRLLVRLSASEGELALREPGVVPFDMMPRPMPGWVTVGREALRGEGLTSWLERARAHVESLPPK